MRLAITLAVVLGFLIAATVNAMGQERVLHAFNGRDGAGPVGGLIFDMAGNLYGTTVGGGDNRCECGTVFELSPTTNGKWTRTVLHSFTIKDGAAPFAGLISDAAGNLYGTTWIGGSPCNSNCGLVFKLSPGANGKWVETILHEFNGPDGAEPYAGLIFDTAGSLYGTTSQGGTQSCCGFGTVFKLSPGPKGKWTETVLHRFNGKDGATPYAGVTFDASGNLYGTTFSTTDGVSTVFRLSPGRNGKWTHTVLHTFNGEDGAAAYAGVFVDGQGSLYGTTYGGGAYGLGVIYKLSPQTGVGWTETILHSFDGMDGANPEAALILDAKGNLYGTTFQGGNSSSCPGCGTVFKLSPGANDNWKEMVLRSFGGADGDGPSFGSLIFSTAGNLYGTTRTGGDLPACQNFANGCGVVFEVRP